MSRYFTLSYIVAYWAKADGKIREYNDMGLTPQPGVFKYFIKDCLMVGNQSYTHWFVYCDWFLTTPGNIKNTFRTKISFNQQDLLLLY